jgi:hypothetical protein
LCNKEFKRVKAYFLNKVVVIKEYYKKKETEKAEDVKAKKAKKV